MRYRIYFENEIIQDPTPVEVEGADLRVIGHKRVTVKASVNDHLDITLFFGDVIKRIADDHNHTIFSI